MKVTIEIPDSSMLLDFSILFNGKDGELRHHTMSVRSGNGLYDGTEILLTELCGKRVNSSD